MAKESSDTESKDANKFQIVKSKKVNIHSVENFCANLKEYGGFGSFRYVKYETRNNDEKRQIEEAIICTLLKFWLAPLELAKSLPNGLYLHIDNRWKYAMDSEKQIKERSLAHLFSNMSVAEIKEHLTTYNSKFFVKQRALKLMNGLYIDVENETKAKWQEIFKIKDVDEQTTVEIIDVTEHDPDVTEQGPDATEQDPADTIQIDEDVMDTKEPE